MAYNIAVIPGDGIGPEVIHSAIAVLIEAVFDASYQFFDNVGYKRHKQDGISISDEEMDAIRSSDAILKGPLYTPPERERGGYRSLVVQLRRDLDLYANIRPFPYYGIDTIVVRENTEGLYGGEEHETEDGAVATKKITRKGSERIHRVAFNLAERYGRKRVTCVHKANIMPLTDGLFLKIFQEVAGEYPHITADEILVDNCANQIQRNPKQFDILVTINEYGDYLSDQLAGAGGSLGLYGSMNIGERYALFEPIHGTADDIAGHGSANPIGAIMAASLMARYLGENAIANIIEFTVRKTLEDRRNLTRDLGGDATTQMMVDEIIYNLEEPVGLKWA